MGPSIIARNYAETLLALAERHGGRATVEEYARAMDAVTELLRQEPRVREFLETPRVGAEERKRALRVALSGRVPDLFLRFLLVLVEKRRQGLLVEIAAAYDDLVDEVLGRVRVQVTLAREADAAFQEEIRRSLEQKLGKTVVASFRVDPALIGGILVRVGDRVMDGSLRRRAGELRRRMVRAHVPRAVAAG